MLSGQRDSDFLILNKLNDKELGLVCQSNKYVNQLCLDPNFWNTRLALVFNLTDGQERIREYLGLLSLKDLYIYLNSLKTFEFRDDTYNTSKYIPKFLEIFKDQTLINKMIKINEPLPKWINKDEIIFELRRQFPYTVLKFTYEPNYDGAKFMFSPFAILKPYVFFRIYRGNNPLL